VVGFVKTVAPPAVTQAPAKRLEEAARSWLDSINARKLSLADDLIAEDAIYHVSADAFGHPADAACRGVIAVPRTLSISPWSTLEQRGDQASSSSCSRRQFVCAISTHSGYARHTKTFTVAAYACSTCCCPLCLCQSNPILNIPKH
jgi:hypothetical protein